MFDESLSDTIKDKRFHHQLAPMHIHCESGFNETILKGLKDIGHKVFEESIFYGFVAVTGIARTGNALKPVYDNRRHGSTFVF